VEAAGLVQGVVVGLMSDFGGEGCIGDNGSSREEAACGILDGVSDGGIFGFDCDYPGVWSADARDEIEDSGLAGAVGAEQQG
jgi:hypothetical protein